MEWLAAVATQENYRSNRYYIPLAQRPKFLELSLYPTKEEEKILHVRRNAARPLETEEVSIPSALGMGPGEAVPSRPSGRARHVGDVAAHTYGGGKRR